MGMEPIRIRRYMLATIRTNSSESVILDVLRCHAVAICINRTAHLVSTPLSIHGRGGVDVVHLVAEVVVLLHPVTERMGSRIKRDITVL